MLDARGGEHGTEVRVPSAATTKVDSAVTGWPFPSVPVSTSRWVPAGTAAGSARAALIEPEVGTVPLPSTTGVECMVTVHTDPGCSPLAVAATEAPAAALPTSEVMTMDRFVTVVPTGGPPTGGAVTGAGAMVTVCPAPAVVPPVPVADTVNVLAPAVVGCAGQLTGTAEGEPAGSEPAETAKVAPGWPVAAKEYE